MAEYNINFSTNASQIAKELSKVQTELAKAVQMAKPSGLEIKLSLNTSQLEASINTTFRKLNKEIESNQRKLSRLQIGGGNFDLIAGRLGRAEGQKERGQLLAAPSRLRGQAEAFEFGSEIRSKKILESLRIEASQIAPNTVEWTKLQQLIGQVTLGLKQADKTAESIQLTQQLGALAPGSLSRLDKQLTILKNRARDITPNTAEWKKLNKEIQKVETSIAKVSKKPLSAGQRAGAAGGAFLYGGGMGGGVGSAFGGIAGGLAGGVPGAFAGAAIGQVADNLGTALAGITSQAAAVQKMQRGLAMASVDAKDFAEAQAAVGEMSQKLLMPLEQTTEYFAQLRANTKEYNLSVADTKEILEGTALAIMATGGSAEDLDGAMRAVVQIMSKGGVQAEELRGQLGERFPGAVVKFAQANKMSFEELQAGLEAGTIGIREFINFAKKNYTDYAKFSEQLATAPEYAGQRLKMALEQISLEIGGLFGPMGADIQDLLTGTINNIAQFIKDNRAYLRQMISDFSSIVGPIAKVFVELMKVIANFSVQVGKIFQGLFAGIRQALGMASIGEAKVRLEKAKAATAGKTRPTRNAPGGGTTTSAEFIELEAAQRAFSGMGGQAAFDKANAPAQPSNLTFGGAGAGMSIDRAAKEDKENKKKVDNLESFERLRDQLANAYNQAEIERIKAEYELRKRLQEDMYDMQEFGANRLQRQNLQFLRALAKAEQDRQDTLMDAQLKVAEAAGKIAPSAPILPSAGGAGSRMSIVDVGKALQKEGFTVKEHPAFGGVTPGVHSPRGYHPTGEAIDVTDWRGGDWKGRTAGLKQAMGGVGFAERLGPGDKGHETHVHLAVGSGGISQEMFNKALATITGQGGIGAGAPRKVGSNESRDTMAGASVDIAQQNAALAARNALIVKGSAESKAFAQYIQESFDLPDLRLSNDLLKMRNDLIAAGVSEEEITHRQRLFEINYKYNDLLKKYPGLAGLSIDIDGKRVSAIDFLKDALNEATVAERAKNDETLRGIAIQRENQMQEALRSAAPLGGMGLSAGYIGSSGQKFEEVFQQTGSKETAAYFAELQNQLTLLETRNGAIQSSIMAIGDAFGTAMTTGIASLIDGTATAQEVFATFLKSIGQALLQAAQQMIATYIAIGIAKIFAGLGGGGGDPVKPGGDWMSAVGRMSTNANGNAFGANGIMPFAKGGAFTNSIVSSPTMFKFADGGAMRTGLMGEAGPEAIMPLSRGADGSLGVQANGLREAMDRQQGGASGSPVLNMSFQSTSINGVEYVSRDQLESAMAETRRNATRDGAKRGMTMTLDRIQNSSSTRRKVGI
jgi:tape measure domain-containing protein